MKILYFLFIIFLFNPFSVFSSGVEIAERLKEKRKLIIDLTLSRIIEREMENKATSSYKVKDSNEGYLKISYPIFEAFQPYIKVGSTQYQKELRGKSLPTLGKRDIDLEYKWDIGYGGGVCGRFNLLNDFFIGYDGQYLISENELKSVKHNGEDGVDLNGKEKFSQLSFSGYLGKDFISKDFTITPYIGARYSKFSSKVKDTLNYRVSEGTISIDEENQEEDRIGGFLGLNLKFYDKFRINMQGRFLNEEAFTFSVGGEF